jgi:pimeloyl-ACP methyl ester carboxylesterase
LIADLVHAARVRTVVIPNATHFVHLDRPEHGQREFLQEVLAFLSDRD